MTTTPSTPPSGPRMSNGDYDDGWNVRHTPSTCTYRQTDHWTRKGLVHAEAPGSGYLRLWDPQEWRVLTVIGLLVNTAGLALPAAAKAARRYVEDQPPGDHYWADRVTVPLSPGVTLTIGPIPIPAQWYRDGEG